MIIFRKYMPRRTFLRGLGVSIALPALDAMIPALARAADIKPPLRVGYFYSPNGIVRDYFRPVKGGMDYEMTDTLRPWEPFRDQLLVLSNMDNGETESISGHTGGSSMFLTGAAPNKS